MEIENRARTLPTRTFSSSCGAKPGHPFGYSSDLSGGGPPGLSRARENELHGVPIQAAIMSPDRIHPRILAWTFCESRSFLMCHLMSNSKQSYLGREGDDRHAAAHLPEPENNSRTTGPRLATINYQVTIYYRSGYYRSGIVIVPLGCLVIAAFWDHK